VRIEAIVQAPEIAGIRKEEVVDDNFFVKACDELGLGGSWIQKASDGRQV
jgi:hypothetical protein